MGERLRADLHPTWKQHKSTLKDFRKKLIETDASEFISDYYGVNVSKNQWEENPDGANFEYIGEKSITTLEEALEFSKADLSIFEVERYVFNSWDVAMAGGKRTNYQVKVWFTKKDQSITELVESFREKLSKPPVIKKVEGSGIGIAATADYHIGAEIRNLPRTPDFDLDVIRNKLIAAADKVNKMNYKEVHAMCAGDLVESISGLNHLNTFKSLSKGVYGENAIILAFEMIRDNYISRINNLKSFSISSGNHDRITPKSDVDNEGAGAAIVAYMLKMQYPNLEINHNHLIVVKKIDNICYLLLHGHHSMAKKDLTKLLFDYGDPTMYNVILEGHWHSRSSKKGSRVVYQDKMIVEMDDLNYRKLTVPPLFTGNFFSESIGFGSTSGELIIENNGDGNINVFDFTI